MSIEQVGQFILLVSASLISDALQAASVGTSTSGRFLSNQGQWEAAVLFKGTSTSTSISFLNNGLSFAQIIEEHGEEGPDPTFQVWNMYFVDANPTVLVKGETGRKSVHSYLSGNDPEGWVVHPAEYEEVRYQELYNGIDLNFRTVDDALKYDYIVHGAGELHHIKNTYAGIQGMRINAVGDLEVTTPNNLQVQKAPVSWQVIDGVKHPVRIEYELLNDNTFGFTAPLGYSKEHDLIIDPLFEMVWSSHTLCTGGSNNLNYSFANAMDAQGNVYLTGKVDSSFPITPGSYSGPSNVSPQIFVAKFSSDGTTMLYSTYLPGNSGEYGTSIAVDALGRAYVTGRIDVNITGINTYPTTPTAFQPAANSVDACLTVLDPAGASLVYSTFLGGQNADVGYDVALGELGTAYITGSTSIGNFPVVASATYPSGTKDIFVSKFDITQSGAASLVYSCRIGGGPFSFVQGQSIAVDSAGSAYVVGAIGIGSGSLMFPVTPGAYSTTYVPGMDGESAYALKLSSTLPVSIEYATYIGPGRAGGIAVDPFSGEAYITGTTRTFAFPTTVGALQTVHGQDMLGNANEDAFVCKLNPTGTSLLYSTFLGGPVADEGTGIAINSIGEAYAVGIARHSFPTSPLGYQPINAGSNDMFVVHLNSTGTGYGCGGATYVGGSSSEYYGSFDDYYAPQVSIRDHGGVNDTISVNATTHSTDFPTTPGVYGPTKVNGGADQPVFFKMTCQSNAVAPPSAAFNTTVSTDCLSASVDFQDISMNGPTAWNWSYPGGTPATSSVQHPQNIVYPATGTYTVSLVACNSLGCDTLSQLVQITVPPPPTVDIGNDTAFCAGGSALLSAGPGYASYAWSLNGTPLGNMTPTQQATAPGTYTVLVTDTTGCAAIDTVVVNELISPVALFSFTTGSSCRDSTVIFQNNSVNATGHAWSFGDGSSSTTVSPTHTYASPGTYSVMLVVNNGICLDSIAQNITLSVGTLPQVHLGNDTAFCAGGSVLLSAMPGLSNYSWALDGVPLGISTPSITATTAGSYAVTVTDSTGCSGMDVIAVGVLDSPQALLSFEVESSCLGTLVRFLNNSVDATTYSWSFGDGASSADVAPVHGYAAGSYPVSLVAFNGPCSDTAISVVMVTDTAIAPLPDISNLPNVFTPNGDGKNDCFPFGTSDISACQPYELQIFNRWGNVVYSNANSSRCWNGRHENGDALAEGTYYYVLTFGVRQFHGYVALLR